MLDINIGQKANKLRSLLDECDCIAVGAGAGLSSSAGLSYSGIRFYQYFGDLAAKYGFRDMYSGGFIDYQTPNDAWSFWSRNIWINRHEKAPKRTYDQLLELIKDKDYFVLTTNVDHQFQLAGFDKQRLFYTQGDYGLLQCSQPCHHETYDNCDLVKQMLSRQGFSFSQTGKLLPPASGRLKPIPNELLPTCPRCGRPLKMNLRADDTFVEDKGWYAAYDRYQHFIHRNIDRKILFLELGVGMNTPSIIKYPFWQFTLENRNTRYVCINKGSAFCPTEISQRSICIDSDIDKVLTNIRHNYKCAI